MKIDTKLIDGFDSMSAEEKLNAILNMEIEDPKPDTSIIDKLKASLTKATAEAAENKRKLNEKLTESEKEAAERSERDKEIAEELAALRLEKDAARFTALGFKAESAESMAKSIINLDKSAKDAYFEAFAAEIGEMKKTIKADLIKETKGVEGGGRAESGYRYKSKDDILNIRDTTERQKAIEENMELFVQQ